MSIRYTDDGKIMPNPEDFRQLDDEFTREHGHPPETDAERGQVYRQAQARQLIREFHEVRQAEGD